MSETDLQAALTRYQAATDTTYRKRLAWEDAKQAETTARLEMNNAAKEEEAAAADLLTAVQQPGLVLVALPDGGTLPPPPPPPADAPLPTDPVGAPTDPVL